MKFTTAEGIEYNVKLDERIATDKKAKVTGYYTYIKYYELLRELYFKSEDIISPHNRRLKATLTREAIESVLNKFDADTKKYGHTPNRKLDWKYLAKRCKEFERLIKARV